MDKGMRRTYRFKVGLTNLEKPSAHWIYGDIAGVPEFVLTDAKSSLVTLFSQLSLSGCAPKTGMNMEWSATASNGLKTLYQLTADPLSDTAYVAATTGELDGLEVLRQS